MGRNSKPSEVKELEGDLGKRGIPEEVEIELSSTEPPEGMTKKARKYWRKYAPILIQLGKLTVLNEQPFKQLCGLWAEIDKRAAVLEKDFPSGLQESQKFGETVLVEHEYVKMNRRDRSLALSYEKAFGITPDKAPGLYKPKRKTDGMEELLD